MQKLLKRLEKADKLLKYLVASILIAVPLYPKFPLFNIPGTQVAIRLEDFLLFVTTLVWFVSNIGRLRSLIRDSISRAIILFWIAGLVSVLGGIFLTHTVVLTIGFFHWARRIEYMIVFFIAYSSLKRRDNLAFYIKVLLLVGVYLMIFGVGQKYFNWPVITTQNSEYAKGIALRYRPGGHLISTFAGHYDLAAFAVVVLPLIFALFVSEEKILRQLGMYKNMIVSRAILFVVGTSLLWLLVNAASRISLVAYLGVLTLVFVFLKRYKILPFVLIFSIIFTLFSSNLISRYLNIFTVTFDKLSQVEYVYAAEAAASSTPSSAPEVEEDRSTSIRLNVEWPRAVRAFEKNPFLGTGFSSITLATDNDFLRLAGEMGILGVLSFGLIFIHLFLNFFENCKRDAPNLEDVFAASIALSIPGVFLNMVFIDILEASKFAIIFWLLLGLAVRSVLLNKNE